MNEMPPSCEAHLHRVKERVTQLMDAKYRKGQAEHGGYLWRRRMMPEVMAEVLDLVSYVLTMEEQVEEARNLCVEVERGQLEPSEAIKRIKKLI